MTTFRQIQDEVLQTLHGFGLEQPRVAFLSGSIASGATLTFTVADSSVLNQGICEIEDELVFISSVNRGTHTATVPADGRGFYGTTAAAHASGVRVTMAPTWPRNRVKTAINDIITASFPTLFGVASTTFTFVPSITTYSLPSDCERVLSVSAAVNGPSLEQQMVRQYAFNSVAPSGVWPTTNTITLHESVTPGKTVTVNYMKQPTALANDGDQLTTSGLRETAKLAVVYGACSQLVSYMDVARLPVDTAQSDEFVERNQVGIASRVAAQLYTRFASEMEKERVRLRAITPVPFTMRKR